MFNIGDTVLYGATGVCQVTGKTEREIGNQKKEYFVLKPLSADKCTVFVPTDNEKLLCKARQILSREEIIDIIHRVPACDDIWIEDEKQRKETFSEIMHSGDRLRLMLLVRTLYRRSKQRASEGKRLHIGDERLLNEAERLLHNEFSAVLGISADSVADFITENIKEKD